MKNKLQNYTSDIKDKTIMVFCNDCYSMNSIIPQQKIIVYTSFGNIDISDKTDLQYFKDCIENKGYSRIIVAGHYHCMILKSIIDNADLKLWNKARKELAQLNKKIAADIVDPEKRFRELVKHNVFEQVRRLFVSKPLRKSIEEGKLEITGIVIDDEADNRVYELHPAAGEMIHIN